MFSFGLIILALGGYLLDCAVQNRPPIGTLVSLVRDPSNVRATLANSKQPGGLLPGTIVGGSNDPGDNNPSATAADHTAAATSGAAGTAIAFARAQIGKPYKWGATGPDSWDCSGLVQAAWRAGGVNLTRTTATMQFQGAKVLKADLQPGDLVFPDLHHVQLYTGDGRVVEAPETGKNVREVAMWGFTTARRVTPTTSSLAAKLGSLK